MISKQRKERLNLIKKMLRKQKIKEVHKRMIRERETHQLELHLE